MWTLPLLFILCIRAVVPFGENANTTQLADELEALIEETNNYEPPDDLSEYLNATNQEPIEYGTYDFIIVGSGPAGSVIANRLTEIGEWQVLLLEAGPNVTDLNKLLSMYGYVATSEDEMGYVTVPQTYACQGMENKQCAPRGGRVLGGASSINGGFYLRAHPGDFQRWVDVYGAQNWTWEEVLPYYIKSENVTYEPRDDEYHGHDGYLTVSNDVDSETTEPLLNAFYEQGFSYEDFNGVASDGVSRIAVTMKGNERASAVTSFINRALNRTNLKVSINSYVTKVIVDDDNVTVTGVIFVKNQTKYIAYANKEIIISGGPYNSAFLLLHSGIGPSKDLEALDIPVIADLPVGQYYQDHSFFLGFYIKTNRTLYNYTFLEQVKRYQNHLRPLTNQANVVAWSSYGDSAGRPNIEWMTFEPYAEPTSVQKMFRFSNATVDSMGGTEETDLSLFVSLFHPKSRGTITLKSSDPKDKPLIDSNNYADPDDVEVMLQAINMTLALNETETFRNFQMQPVLQDAPGCKGKKGSRKWIICAIRYYGSTNFHPTSANLMGNDTSKSVVNHRLLVHGFVNLRVADTSIFPETVSGHPHSTSYMTGERCADFIKEDYGKL